MTLINELLLKPFQYVYKDNINFHIKGFHPLMYNHPYHCCNTGLYIDSKGYKSVNIIRETPDCVMRLYNTDIPEHIKGFIILVVDSVFDALNMAVELFNKGVVVVLADFYINIISIEPDGTYEVINKKEFLGLFKTYLISLDNSSRIKSANSVYEPTKSVN